MMIKKTVRINDVAYNVLYALPADKPKSEADTAVRRYSTANLPAILMQSANGEWVVARKIIDVIFTDIEASHETEDSPIAKENPGGENGINNKEEN